MLPDRVKVNMDVHFLNSYAQLVIQSCHQHGIHAMGGMAAQIPIKNNPDANASALNKVRLDKEREVRAGHDGNWVAHPGLVSIAEEADDVYETISAIIDWMFYIIMFGVAIMVAIAAFSFLTAAGDPDKTSKARNYIIYALVGAVVGFLAKGIMMIVATALGVEGATFW